MKRLYYNPPLGSMQVLVFPLTVLELAEGFEPPTC